jgi:hypothetical protein
MIMKLLACSRGNPKRLLVPIHEFEFNGSAVRVRNFASRQFGARQGVLRKMQRPSRRAMSPVPAAAWSWEWSAMGKRIESVSR